MAPKPAKSACRSDAVALKGRLPTKILLDIVCWADSGTLWLVT
jgi:hypothetical protein